MQVFPIERNSMRKSSEDAHGYGDPVCQSNEREKERSKIQLFDLVSFLLLEASLHLKMKWYTVGTLYMQKLRFKDLPSQRTVCTPRVKFQLIKRSPLYWCISQGSVRKTEVILGIPCRKSSLPLSFPFCFYFSSF